MIGWVRVNAHTGKGAAKQRAGAVVAWQKPLVGRVCSWLLHACSREQAAGIAMPRRSKAVRLGCRIAPYTHAQAHAGDAPHRRNQPLLRSPTWSRQLQRPICSHSSTNPHILTAKQAPPVDCNRVHGHEFARHIGDAQHAAAHRQVEPARIHGRHGWRSEAGWAQSKHAGSWHERGPNRHPARDRSCLSFKSSASLGAVILWVGASMLQHPHTLPAHLW